MEGEEVAQEARGRSRRLTVLFFSDTYHPYVSGVVTSIDTYAAELRRLGHRVIVVAPDYPSAPRQLDVVRLPSVPLPAYPRLRLIAPLNRRLVTRLLRLKPDVVHAHSPFAAGLLALYVARAAQCPTVFTCHSVYEEYTRYLRPLSLPLKGVVRKYLVWYCGMCQLVVAPSRHMRSFLAKAGVDCAVEVLPTGVAGTEAEPAGTQDPLRPGGAFVLALVGRLAKEKNFALALETLFELTQGEPRTRNRWRLVVMGDGPEAPRLKRMAVELGIKNLVSFAGELPRDQVLANLRLADALLFTSTVETQGLVMLEAMSVGLPVVAAESDAARELVLHGQEGLLAEPEPKALADAVRRLASSRAARARMSQAALQRSRAFQPPLLARQLVEHYFRLRSEGATPPPSLPRQWDWFRDPL